MRGVGSACCARSRALAFSPQAAFATDTLIPAALAALPYSLLRRMLVSGTLTMAASGQAVVLSFVSVEYLRALLYSMTYA
jgi:hypothetical protein